MEIDCGESNRGKRGHPMQKERERERKNAKYFTSEEENGRNPNYTIRNLINSLKVKERKTMK